MRKIIIIGFTVAFGLVLLGAGCAPQTPAENVNANNTNAAVNEEAGGNINAVNPGVSAEDLSNLKSDINGLQYDDLNTFSQ
jgi:hypothetical protein